MSQDSVKDLKISGLPKGAKLSQKDINFMKYIEQQNLDRVQKLKNLRTRNIKVGSILGLTAVGIWGYSMYAVKQETFLDDFEEPKKINLDNQ